VNARRSARDAENLQRLDDHQLAREVIAENLRIGDADRASRREAGSGRRQSRLCFASGEPRRIALASDGELRFSRTTFLSPKARGAFLGMDQCRGSCPIKVFLDAFGGCGTELLRHRLR
jgi:hypothetical protein